MRVLIRGNRGEVMTGGTGGSFFNRLLIVHNGRATAEGESLVSFLSQPASLVTSMSASRFRHARFSRLC